MFKNEKILITGVTGRVGGVIAKRIAAAGNTVYGLDLRFSEEQMEEFKAAGITPIKCHLAFDDLTEIPVDVDYVLHYAANCYPKTFRIGIEDNVLSTARLMDHCKNAKAFLYISTTGTVRNIWEKTDTVMYEDEELMGNSQFGILGHYPTSKLATEGAVHALAKVLNLPSIICRFNSPVLMEKGGVPARLLFNIMNDIPIMMPASTPNNDYYFNLIHEEDIAEFMEPLCKAAAVDEVPFVHLVGDDIGSCKEYIAYLEERTGKKAKFVITDSYQGCINIFDWNKRKAITGPAKYTWKTILEDLCDHMIPIYSDPEKVKETQYYKELHPTSAEDNAMNYWATTGDDEK